MRPVATSILAIGALAAVLAGCGGGDEPRNVNPDALLDAAFTHPIDSADTDTSVRLALAGSDALPEPVTLSLTGPFVAADGTPLPRFDFRFKLGVVVIDVGGRVVSTGRNAYLSTFGDNYQLGLEATARLGDRLAGLSLRPGRWFGDPRYEGEEDVNGVDTARISADLRGKQFSDALAPLGDELGLSRIPSPVGRVDAWIGFDDETLHELSIDATFALAPADRARVGGASGGRLQLDTVLDEVNEPQEVRVPRGGGYKPISDLLLTLQDLAG
jgi:hypothetical protein